MVRMVSRVVALSVAVIGVTLGGPQEMSPADVERVVGSDPIAGEPCNGNAKSNASCPSWRSPLYCLEETYEKIDQLQPNTVPKQRFNNGTMKCTRDAAKTQCVRYDLVTPPAVCVQPATP